MPSLEDLVAYTREQIKDAQEALAEWEEETDDFTVTDSEVTEATSELYGKLEAYNEILRFLGVTNNV